MNLSINRQTDLENKLMVIRRMGEENKLVDWD